MAARKSRKRQPTRGERNIEWIETFCRVPEGRLVGKPMTLRPWQRREILKIYDNPAGTRMAILSFGKKNGKTALVAALVLLHLCGPEAIPNTQLPSTAQSRDQASVLFGLASKMVRMNPDLKDCCTIRDSAKQIECDELGTLYKALSKEASTAHGQSPVFAVHDELGQVRGPISPLFDAIENAMSAHAAPLSIVISTQAPNDSDLLSILIDDALAGHDPKVTVSLYAADPKLDPFSVAALKQANPAFGDFQNAEEIKRIAEEARRLPSKEPTYRNYNLNQRVDKTTPFINRTVWGNCAREHLHGLRGVPVYGALDLSAVNDLTCKLYLADHGANGLEAHPTFWLPEMGLAEKSRADRVPYDIWRDQGFLQATPGPTVDYDFVAQSLAEDFDHLDIRMIAFDRWNWKHFKPALSRAGFPEHMLDGDDAVFREFGQGFASMSPAMLGLESALLNRLIAHDGHPVLTMCMANAVVTSDAAGNRKLDKSRASGRIDGAVCLVMAKALVDTAEERAPTASPWDDPNYTLGA
jgi:phage terminase large subunit-like protein